MMHKANSLGDPNFVRWYNEDYREKVHGYQIFATIFVAFMLIYLFLGAGKGAKSLKYASCVIIVQILTAVVSVILEVVAYFKLDPHYDIDMAGEIDSTMSKLVGCGDSNLELAIDFATGRPVIYQRP